MAGEGLTSERLVRLTRLNFIKLFGIVTFVELNTSVLNKYDYIMEGTTHVVLHTANSTYPWIEAAVNDLPQQQWYELLSTELGHNIMAHIEKRGDVWTIIDFDNLDL